MKKRSFLIFALCFLTSAIFAQQLTFRYANPKILRTAGFDNLEFDVQVKADAAGTYLWASSIILPFDNNTLTTTATQWTVTKVAPFNQLNVNAGNPMYGLIKTVTGTSPNCVLNIALVGDINCSPYGPSSDDFVELTTSYQTIVHVRGRIINATGVVGIYFNQTLMNGQQSFISNPDEYTNYTTPNLYDAANFTNAYVGRIYSTAAGWSQVANTVNAQWVDWTTAVNTTVWEGTPSIPGGALSNAAALLINSGATLTVPTTGQLSLTGNTTNNGTLLVDADLSGNSGSFIDNGTITGSGTCTFKKYLSDAGRWWYIGAPVSGITASSVFGALSATPSTGTRLLYRDEANSVFSPVASGDALVAMRGYTYRSYVPANLTATFSGSSFNTGTYGSVNNLTGTGLTSKGFNLVANPFPSAIEYSSTGTGLTRTNIGTTVWYKKAAVFATFNYSGDVSVNGGTKYIPAMQAFWVLLETGQTAGTLQIGNAARLHNATALYKTTSTDNVFRMTFSSNNITDETVVYFSDNALESTENYDSEKMFSDDADVPQLYTLTSDNTQAAINGFPVLGANEIRVVPMGFKTDVAGTFTYEATNLTDFDANIAVLLEDITTGTMHDLRQNSSYSFVSGAANTATRFRLHFNSMTTGVNEIANASTSIYTYGNTVYVTTVNGDGIIEIYDMLGKKLISGTAKPGVNTLQVNAGNGMYLVKVLINGLEKTEKVFLSK